MDETELEVPPRFVFLGESIVSDWRNPQATTSRAVLQALGELGFEADFLEPRRNSPTVGLLGQRGSGPVRAFNELLTDVHYRTVDLPARRETDVWIGQFAATADVIVALQGIPESIERALVEFDAERLQVLVERPELEGDWGRTVLHRLERPEEAIGFRPAVLPHEWDTPRSGTVLVAYDDAELAMRVAEHLPDARRIVSGSADLPGWELVPEIELPPIYGAAERVLVVDSGERPIAPARVWLPRANGAKAWGVVDSKVVERELAVALDELGAVWEQTEPELPKRVDARWVAHGLVELYTHRSV